MYPLRRPPFPSSQSRGRCLAVGVTAAAVALILHIFLQVHYVRSVKASNERAFEIVAAKKRAERAAMMEERQKQLHLREQQAAEAASAAAAHEAAVRREYTALREELRIAEVVPDRHMLLPSMERKIEEMKRERAQLQQLRLQQQAANALRSQQQQSAALAAAELEAQKPKPAARQVPHNPAAHANAAACASRSLHICVYMYIASRSLQAPAVPEHRPFVQHAFQAVGRRVGDASPAASCDRSADRLAAARCMQEQQLQAVAAAASTAEALASGKTSSKLGAAAASCGDDAAAVAVAVKVLTRPLPTVRNAFFFAAEIQLPLSVCARASRCTRTTPCCCCHLLQ
jgi:hypothetical protein